MKKLFIKQKVFKITDHYPITDENQETIYQVDQDFKLIGNTVRVSDKYGSELFVVSKEVFTLLPRFVVRFANGNEVVLKSRFTLFNKEIDIDPDGLKLFLKGDFFDHNFSLYENNTQIGSITEEYFTWGDTFVLTINDESKQDLIVAIMIAVDCIKDDQEKRR
ncbi:MULTISPECIES: LURP-one-related/scramblase family protein [unclassified Fusibacter]|uniref:LURP-one-related/scramblase family protein n=1 Tax=unclassified Fusibacter TaxID=2624464 RepID=UPI001010D3BD|nr:MULTISPECIES: LURP-one-related family protein [unclassified Fusibacter]MCK8058151.1 LURP-one-related family protein [Fusibacter sp. A2]NPE20733.1 hypothetical protein [Fusibacter sp. A1]RXV62939.1 hypothetical protein DWB64_02795 [Fusibacter sp. A1]